ncbi:hypothetical protein [Oscillatoria sp. FACHB-1406]|uniref:hypothetical protein n=1 Tax=Oscillatoria sp. FACHB-1406 TaxID=2692846 RepID=UPI001684DC29|nr:hypothetical protein [Oscillatoria sp. FACHB-1406]MBD2577742.1 hypothetical protein [Oscillatoria sp. FACHB-1406]
MKLSQAEVRQLFNRLIFEEGDPKDWVQDVWDLNPILGDNAARLLEVFEALMECCPSDKLENLLNQYLNNQVPDQN